MKRLNNKGTTIIEIILCFALAALIVISLYNIIDTISTNKKNEETKFEIMNQKTLLTKTILSDIVEKGLQSISINGSKKDISKTVTDTPIDLYGKTVSDCVTFNANQWKCVAQNYTDSVRTEDNIFYSAATSALVVSFAFKNGEQKELRILKQVNNYNLSDGIATRFGDKFYIAYGKPSSVIEYQNVGTTNNELAAPVEKFDFSVFGYETRNKDKLYETGIGNIYIQKRNQFVQLDVRFNNANLSQKYGLHITTPTTIDQAYVDELDEEEPEDSSGDISIPDTLGRSNTNEKFKTVELLYGPLTSDILLQNCDATWCTIRTYTLTEDEENDYAADMEDIPAENRFIVEINFPLLDGGDIYKNTSADFKPAISIKNQAGSVIKSYNWLKTQYITTSNLYHPLLLDEYEEKQKNDGTYYLDLIKTRQPNDNIYITTHNFQLVVSKAFLTFAKGKWSDEQFFINIYEHKLVADPDDAGEEDGFDDPEDGFDEIDPNYTPDPDETEEP